MLGDLRWREIATREAPHGSAALELIVQSLRALAGGYRVQFVAGCQKTGEAFEGERLVAMLRRSPSRPRTWVERD